MGFSHAISNLQNLLLSRVKSYTLPFTLYLAPLLPRVLQLVNIECQLLHL